MRYYCVNKNAQPTGEHEMHKVTCNRLPLYKNQDLLGDFNDDYDAIKAAKEKNFDVDGCAYCCPTVHTK